MKSLLAIWILIIAVIVIGPDGVHTATPIAYALWPTVLIFGALLVIAIVSVLRKLRRDIRDEESSNSDL